MIAERMAAWQCRHQESRQGTQPLAPGKQKTPPPVGALLLLLSPCLLNDNWML